MPDPTFTWSLADTHCVWCGKPTVTAAEWERHDKDPGPCGCDGSDCWCAGYCWRESNPHSCQVGRGVTVLGLRGLVEAQAAVIAELAMRAKGHWAPYQAAEEPTRGYWLRCHPDNGAIQHVDMTQVIYDAVFGTTSEETTP